MPAVTVENILALPRLPEPDPTATAVRPVRQITTAPSGFEGEGFPVRRAFAGVAQADLDPFVHMDQMGEVEYGPGEPKGTPWHPHRGFETVTYMIDGTFQHQDSIGGGGLITNGGTQWMTAGAGHPAHRAAARGPGRQRRPLPRDPAVGEPARPPTRWVAPRYQDIEARGGHPALLPRRRRAACGSSPARWPATTGPGVTHTPITLVHATVSPGARLVLPWPADYNALVYVLAGHGTVGPDDRPVRTGQLAVHGAGDALVLGADDHPGEPLARPRGAGPRRPAHPRAGGRLRALRHEHPDELAQAFEDFHAGRLGTIPADHIGD